MDKVIIKMSNDVTIIWISNDRLMLKVENKDNSLHKLFVVE